MIALLVRVSCIAILAAIACGSITGIILLLQPSRSIQIRKFEVLNGNDPKKDAGKIISQLVTIRIQQIDSVLTSDLTSDTPPDQVRIESVIPPQLRLAPEVQNQLDVEFKAFDFDIAGILNTIVDKVHEGPALSGVVIADDKGAEILANYKQNETDLLGPWAVRSNNGTADAVELLAHRVVLDFHRKHTSQFGSLSVDQFRSLIFALKNYQDYVHQITADKKAGRAPGNNLNLVRARSGLNELAKQDVDCSLVYSYLGSIATILKDEAAAQTNFAKALTIDPSDKFSLKASRSTSAAVSLRPPPAEGPGSLAELRKQPAFRRMHIEEAIGEAGQAGVLVAVLADGAAELSGFRLAPGKDFASGTQDDGPSHGTKVTSIIAAIAPAVTVMPIKVFGQDGIANTVGIVQGIEFAATSKARIIVLPFGTDAPDPLIAEAVRRAIQGGAFVTAAAGNDSAKISRYPASFPGVFSVGAVDLEDKLATFSNYGPSISAVAPGVDILTLDPSGRIQKFNGTSATCAEAAGIAALVLSTTPALNGAQLEEILKETAVSTSDPRLGVGRLDAAAAIAKAKTFQ